MASRTLTFPGDLFPEGTSLGAYPATDWGAHYPSGDPAVYSTAVDTQTVTDGAATFTGLSNGTDYYACGDAGTDDYRYQLFSVPAAIASMARVYHSTTQAATNGAPLILAFDSESYDTDEMHSPSPADNSRLTIRTAGVYLLTAQVDFASNATGVRAAYIVVGGTLQVGGLASAAVAIDQPVTATAQVELAADDYVEVMALQTSGGSLNVLASSSFSAVRLGDG